MSADRPHGDPLQDAVEREAEPRSRDAEPAGGPPVPGGGDGAAPDDATGPATEAETADEAQAAEAADPLARAQQERDEYLRLAQRTQADFDNYRKRAAKDAAAAGARAKAGLLRELLPVVDNLERALASADEDGEGLAEGVRLVHSELLAALGRSGVESFEPVGEQFDPTQQEALSTRPQEDAEPGVVLDVIEKGYRLKDTVLRPARVVVSA